MRGRIYRIAVKHRQIGPHPHVVVIAAGRQCFVVPGYTPGNFKVEQAIAALVGLGTPPDKVHVTLDNAAHVRPLTGFTWHACHWLIAQSYWVGRDAFAGVAADGEMDAAGLAAIVGGLLALAAEKPEMFSDRQVAAVRRQVAPPADDAGS